MAEVSEFWALPFKQRVWLVTWGLRPYSEVLAWQQAWLSKAIDAKTKGAAVQPLILIGQHPAVLTVGKGAKGFTQIEGLETYTTNRGGQATWHTPGQWVVYVLTQLQPQPRTTHLHLRWLEALGEGVLQQYSLPSVVNEKAGRGVWVAGASGQAALKMGSVGVGVKRWCTQHGLALNITTASHPPHTLTLCGLPASSYTSLAHQLFLHGKAVNESTLQQEVLAFWLEASLPEQLKPWPLIVKEPSFLLNWLAT